MVKTKVRHRDERIIWQWMAALFAPISVFDFGRWQNEKKLSLSQMIRLSATLIHFSQLFQLIEFSIFCLKKKFLLQTNENFFKVNSFKFRKKNSGKFRQIGPNFFFLPKSVIWREKTTNEWRRGTKKKKSAGRPEALRLPNAFFFWLKIIFFPWNFTFRVRKKSEISQIF